MDTRMLRAFSLAFALPMVVLLSWSGCSKAADTDRDATMRKRELLAPALIPSAETLEREHAVIGSIDVDNQDIFDPRDPREDRAMFRLTNRMHIETRADLIRQQLLFQPGDPYSERLVQESERILRGLRFLYDAKIEAVRYVDGRVDLQVTTRDVWSLNPGLSFGRRGGKSTFGIELEELNLLGHGVAVAVSSKSGIDRDTHRVDFIDRHLLGTRLELLASYANNSDGNEWLLKLERPFFALDSHHAWGIDLSESERVDPLYSLGEEVVQFRERAQRHELYAGWSSGLQNGWVQRWRWGLTRDEQRFDGLPGMLPPSVIPEDRDLIYPWLGWELIEDQFATERNHDQIERTEDVFLGTRLQARLGYSTSALGADRNALIYQVKADRGFALSERAQLNLSSSLNGRWEHGEVSDLLFSGRARYYLEQGEKWLFFAHLNAEYGRNLAVDHQVLLGGDNGLRGYPLRYQGGDRSARFTVEQRYFSDWYPFRLFRVGAAVFFDAGRTWGEDGLGTPKLGVLKDFGLGLRLGNSRSGLGSMVHIDLAFPMDGPTSIDRAQLLIETSREF